MAQSIVRLVVTVWVVALVGLVCAGEAVAGGYHVYSCRTPGGAVAPVDGWTGYVAPGGAYDQYALNTCASGGALIAALGDVTIRSGQIDTASWTLMRPQARRSLGATLWRAGDNDGGVL